MKRMRVKITFIEETLGTQPADQEIRKTYIQSKAPAGTDDEDDVDEPMEDKGVTIFMREDGKPFSWDYQIKGMFKGACHHLRGVNGTRSAKMTSYKKTIDGNIFVFPRKIFYDLAESETGVCERPLRASTPKGERTALASSETIPAGSSLTFDVCCMKNLDAHTVEEWLDFGFLNGFGQWRNGGKGKFTWELLEEETYEPDKMWKAFREIAESWEA